MFLAPPQIYVKVRTALLGGMAGVESLCRLKGTRKKEEKIAKIEIK